MADQRACSATRISRTLSRVQLIQKSPSLTSPAFLPVHPKPNRHKTTGYLGLCHNTQAYPDSLESSVTHQCPYVKTSVPRSCSSRCPSRCPPGSPSPRHQAPSWGPAQARLGRGPTGRSGLVGPVARQGRAVRSWLPALLQHCWGRG